MQRIKALFDPEGLLNPGVLLNAERQGPHQEPQAHAAGRRDGRPLHRMRLLRAGLPQPPHDAVAAPAHRGDARAGAAARVPARTRRVSQRWTRASSIPGSTTCAAGNVCAIRCPVGIETGTMVIGERRAGAATASGAPRTLSPTIPARSRRLMRTGVGAQALSRTIIGNGATDALARVARKVSGERVPRVTRALAPGPGTPDQPVPMAAPVAAAARIVYFPSCRHAHVRRAETGLGLLAPPTRCSSCCGAPATTRSCPKELTGQCCGQPFQSKGFPEEAARVGAGSTRHSMLLPARHAPGGHRCLDLRQAHAGAWRHGARQRRVPAHASAAASDDHAEAAVSRSITIARRSGSRSSRNRGDRPCMRRRGRGAVAVTCCGYAGDKGLFVPELNAHATRFVKGEIPPDCTLGVSTVSTCATGLSEHSGIPFVRLRACWNRVAPGCCLSRLTGPSRSAPISAPAAAAPCSISDPESYAAFKRELVRRRSSMPVSSQTSHRSWLRTAPAGGAQRCIPAARRPAT